MALPQGSGARRIDGGASRIGREATRASDSGNTDPRAVDEIEAPVVAQHENRPNAARRWLHVHRTYVDNNKDRMRRAELVEFGLSVGSGPIEGPSKSLVMPRTMSWSQDGLSNVLVPGGLGRSGRLDGVLAQLGRMLATDVQKVAA